MPNALHCHEPCHFLGIDVGTGSARAGVFDATGTMLASAKRDIALFLEPGDIVEQSSEDIWRAVCASVREAVDEVGRRRARRSPASASTPPVRWSCVGRGRRAAAGRPLGRQPSATSSSGWITARSTRRERINAGEHAVLDYVGGTISPEMETPKLLWLRENLPDTFDAAWQFFDLTDYPDLARDRQPGALDLHA